MLSRIFTSVLPARSDRLKTTYLRAARWLLPLVFLGLARASWARDGLAIVVGEHAPPFRIFTSDNRATGLYFDLLQELAKRIDLTLEFRQVPSARALYMMNAGEADIMIGPNRSPDREAYMLYVSTPLPAATKAFYALTGEAEIRTLDDLRGKVISIERGKSYFPQFDQDTTLRKDPVNHYRTAILKVAAGRSDVVLMPELEGDYLLKEMGVKLKKSPLIVEGQPSYLTISRRSFVVALAPKIEEALAQMKATGVVEQIMRRYR